MDDVITKIIPLITDLVVSMILFFCLWVLWLRFNVLLDKKDEEAAELRQLLKANTEVIAEFKLLLTQALKENR